MDKSQWVTCRDPRDMLLERRGLSDRKLILFACACCRRHEHLVARDCCQATLDAAERFVDDFCSEPELRLTRQRLEEQASVHYPEQQDHAETAVYFASFETRAYEEFKAAHGHVGPSGEHLDSCDPFDSLFAALKDQAACHMVWAAYLTDLNDPENEVIWKKGRAAQAAILRDIAGNPFVPVQLARSELHKVVWDMAAAIYSSRAFDRLPILADALEEAGCADAEILAHCRGPGPHVRGCWVVDLILGKE